MKILFFHGFESTLPSSKATWMEDQGHEVLAHPMGYQQPDAFFRALECAREFQPELIAGSSMGGYFAVLVGSHLPTKLVLLNPALISRSKEYNHVDTGSFTPRVWALLGKNDELIDPKASAEKLRLIDAAITIGDHAHRTPLDIFIPYMESVFIQINEEYY